MEAPCISRPFFWHSWKEKCSLNAREMFSPQLRTADLCLKRQRVLGLWVRHGSSQHWVGPRGPALGPGADTAHTGTCRGTSEVLGGCGPRGQVWTWASEGHRSDQAPEGLRRPVGGACSEPGSEPGATAARGEACTRLDGAVSTAPGSRAQPAECTSHPEWPYALPIPECLPTGDCPLCARPR